MAVHVHLSAWLAEYAGTPRQLALEADSVRAALDGLARQEPKLQRAVCDETGAVRRHVNVYVGTRHIRDLQGLDTPLRPGDELVFIQAVSGG